MNLKGRASVDLASVPLFEGLSPEILEVLVAKSLVRAYPQGQILCNEGDPGHELIVLESGQLRISRFTADGDEAVLAVYDAPAAIGELALLDGAPRDATVSAQRKVTVRLIPRDVFMNLIEREPQALRGLLRTLATMIREANERHADMLGLDVPGRLAKWLLRQASMPGSRGGAPGTTVELNRSQSELAAELGTTRSTLNRALHDFEALGFLSIDGNRITLLRSDRLRGYLS